MFRKQIEHLEYRKSLWQHVIGLLKTVHRHRLPGRRFGPDVELLMIYGAATVACFSRGKFTGSTDIARYLGMPRETVRRHLVRLIDLGLLERDGHKFRLSPAAEKMPENVVQILSDQVESAANLARLGRKEIRRLAPPPDYMTTPAPLWGCLPDGHSYSHNRAWCSVFNMADEQAHGTGWTALIHQDDRNAVLQPWLRSLATGEPYETVARYRDRSGEYHWYRANAAPVLNESRKIIQWHGMNIRTKPLSADGGLSSRLK